MKKTIQHIIVLTLILNSILNPVLTLATVLEDNSRTVEEVELVDRTFETSVLTDLPVNTIETSEIAESNEDASQATIEDFTIEESSNVTKSDQLEHELLDSSDIKFLTRFDLYSLEGENPTYLTGVEAVLNVGLSATSSTNDLNNYTVKIRLQKKYINKSSIEASSSESQTGLATIEEDAENFIITYLFSNVSSGTSIDVPIKFKTLKGETPNNYVLKAVANIYDSTNREIGQDSININYITKTPSSNKQARDLRGTFTFDSTNLYGGKLAPDNPEYLSKNLNELVPVDFNYQIRKNFRQGGYRYYDKFIIKDVLPKESVFDSNLNPGWVYDPISHTAEYTYENKILIGERDINLPTIRLLFPGAKIETYMTNKMSVTAIPSNKQEYEENLTVSDDINFKFIDFDENDLITGYKAGSYESIYDNLNYLKNYEGNWYLVLRNEQPENGKNLENIILRDYKLDKRMYYSKIEFPVISEDILKGTIDVIGVYSENGQRFEKTIAKDISLNQSKHLFELGKEIDEVIIKSSNQFTKLKPQKQIGFYIYTKFRNPEEISLENGESPNFSNSLTIESNFDGSQSKKVIKSEAYKTLKKLAIRTAVYKSLNTSKKSYFVNDEVSYRLQVIPYGLIPEVSLDYNKIVDLIPPGFEYIEGTTDVRLNYNFKYEKPSLISQSDPEIVSNYKGTGLTALIWTLSPINLIKSNARPGSAYELYYKLKISKYSEIGRNINTVFLSWNNTDEVSPYKSNEGQAEDQFDLNENGRTDDLVSRDSAEINYIPPREVITTKSVKKLSDKNFVSSTGAARLEVGSDGIYEMKVFNNTDQDLKELILLDILPHPNDYTVGISSDSNLRVPRNSNFPIQLRGPVSVPEGYQVFYTADVPINNVKEYTLNANWTSSPSDFEKVRAIKIQLTPGNSLGKEQQVSFTVSFKTPKDETLKNGDKAVNSFGTALSNSLDYFESNNATVEIMRYQISGYLFVDDNRSSSLDDTEKRFNSHIVSLVDSNGKPILDSKNNPYMTITDENGYYQFNILNSGEYRVKILTPDKYSITKPAIQLKGGQGSYDLTVFNNLSEALNNVTVLDILPHKGDKTVGISAESSVPLNRGSEFSVQLTGPVTAPSGYQVSYTTDAPTEDSKDYTQSANWTTSPSDYSKVRAIKITLESGKILDSGDRVNFTVPFKVPMDTKLTSGMQAVNSFGTAINTNPNYFESNNAPVQIVRYQVNGHLFEDSNENSLREPDETPITNHTVALVDENGDPVLGTGNQPMLTQTDDKGYYQFDVLRAGNYRVKVITPENHVLTQPKADQAEGSAIMDETTGLTDVFSLTKMNLTATKNAGYIYIRPTITITGKKTWVDANNQDGIRPKEVTVRLMNGDTEVASQTVSEATDWKYSFKDVPVKQNGQEITYTVTEDAVEGYETIIDGFNITNTHTPAVAPITVKKVWDDTNNQDGLRPQEVTVRLMNGDTEVATEKLTEDKGWEHTFKDLPVNEVGKKITYTVTEDKVNGYETKIDGFTITNKHVPAVKDIEGKKIWDDANNQDGLRPQEVTVRLMNGDTEVATQTVSEATDWKYSFKDVPVKQNGQEINYTVTEDAVDEYETKIDGFNITNKHVPAIAPISGQKIWDDAEDQDGIRPDEITVRLLADGEEVDKQTVTASNDWTYTFENAPMRKDGQLITYGVSEDPVTGYETMIDGFTITNKHIPGKPTDFTTIHGQKVWEDADNKAGLRPESITVRLHANGKEVSSQTVSQETNWKYSFKDLPVIDENDAKITYTVSEDEVEGYETIINGYTITNKLSQKQTPPASNIPKEPTDNKGLPITGESSSSVLITLAGGVLLTGIGIILLRKK
ncbi:Cna B-type domain-containing protein [Facklamia sp. 7083-14-GEN3]|uniref:Cna B-type domain-containing protein n=1 Tax=Facklamia sp. 7083-14-GEN3 TaxID=2973478 RepID=UPI00215C784B|nr:Cna B-type domain-containing protein [Facklamia sp. 7083-14-GEN3]MCR8968515.1 Cna B-type domain-containing protein [Facklamia sp. 7083-14-GEN3]